MDWIKKHKFLTFLIAIVILFVLAGAGGTESNSSSTNTTDEWANKKFDHAAAYNKIKKGMTKAEVEKAINKEPEHCSEFQSDFGKSESCTYGNFITDNGDVSVDYENGKVSSKSKGTY